MKHDIGYLTAKLEAMHADIRILQDHVDVLRQESSGRKAIQKFLVWGMGAVCTVVGWLTTVVSGLIS